MKESKSFMEITDITGLSKPLKKLIEVVSQGVGAITKPYLIKKNADAKAYEIKVISAAIRENQDELGKIDFNDQKIKLSSIDVPGIKEVDSLQDRTENRLNYKEQKRQRNIESITAKAAENLESESNVSDEEVDEDWTTRFFSYAEDISNNEMQEIWARILAGEVKKPKSFSLRTLDTLRNLSKEDAEVFMKFARLAIEGNSTSFIINFKNEKLLEEKYDLKFKDRLLLEELGFLTANDLEYTVGATQNQPVQVVFTTGNFVVLYNKEQNKAKQGIPVLVFTKIGQQLLKLVTTTPDLDYIQLFASKLNRENGKIQFGYIIEKLGDGRVRYASLQDVPLTENEKEAGK